MSVQPRPATSRLYDPREAQAFYEARYERGYMEDYSAEAKQRLAEIIRSLPLPAQGSALDFGCGNGVLTDVLREALPGWQICGADLSATAISNARARFPRCTFLELDEDFLQRQHFDLIFSHHVLEHVSDLRGTIARLAAYAQAAAAMSMFSRAGTRGASNSIYARCDATASITTRRTASSLKMKGICGASRRSG